MTCQTSTMRCTFLPTRRDSRIVHLRPFMEEEMAIMATMVLLVRVLPVQRREDSALIP